MENEEKRFQDGAVLEVQIRHNCPRNNRPVVLDIKFTVMRILGLVRMSAIIIIFAMGYGQDKVLKTVSFIS